MSKFSTNVSNFINAHITFFNFRLTRPPNHMATTEISQRLITPLSPMSHPNRKFTLPQPQLPRPQQLPQPPPPPPSGPLRRPGVPKNSGQLRSNGQPRNSGQPRRQPQHQNLMRHQSQSHMGHQNLTARRKDFKLN